MLVCLEMKERILFFIFKKNVENSSFCRSFDKRKTRPYPESRVLCINGLIRLILQTLRNMCIQLLVGGAEIVLSLGVVTITSGSAEFLNRTCCAIGSDNPSALSAHFLVSVRCDDLIKSHFSHTAEGGVLIQIVIITEHRAHMGINSEEVAAILSTGKRTRTGLLGKLLLNGVIELTEVDFCFPIKVEVKQLNQESTQLIAVDRFVIFGVIAKTETYVFNAVSNPVIIKLFCASSVRVCDHTQNAKRNTSLLEHFHIGQHFDRGLFVAGFSKVAVQLPRSIQTDSNREVVDGIQEVSGSIGNAVLYWDTSLNVMKLLLLRQQSFPQYCHFASAVI